MNALTSPSMLCFGALGAFVHWLMLRYGLKNMDEFVDDILSDASLRMVGRIFFSVAFGTVLALVLVDPTTERQALAAGMAWTTLVAGVTSARTRAKTKERSNG